MMLLFRGAGSERDANGGASSTAPRFAVNGGKNRCMDRVVYVTARAF
jgi:hypothetical protein